MDTLYTFWDNISPTIKLKVSAFLGAYELSNQENKKDADETEKKNKKEVDETLNPKSLNPKP